MTTIQLPKASNISFSNSAIKPTVPSIIDESNVFGASAVLSVFPEGAWGTGVNASASRRDIRVANGAKCSRFRGSSRDRVEYHLGLNDTVNIQTLTVLATFTLETNTQPNYIVNLGARVNLAVGKEGIASGNIGVSYYDGAFEVANLDAAPEVGALYTMMLSKQQGSAARATLFKNGVFNSTATLGTTSDIIYNNAREFSIGALGSWSGTNNSSDVCIHHVAVLKQALSAAQQSNLAAAPYQMLKPAVPQVYFPVTVAGALNISPTGIASAESFGTGVITTGSVDLAPTGIVSTEAFGTAVLTQGVFVTPNGIASEEAFGTAVLTTGAVIVTPSGIASTEAFGTADVSQATFITPTGIASAEAFGTAVITTGAVTLTPTGISSEEAFGSHTIAAVGDKDIKIDFANELVLTSNLQSTTIYYNGTDYFTIN